MLRVSYLFMPQVNNLSKFMLRDNRQYVIDKVNAPILKALVILANRLPKINKQNTVDPNTHVLIDNWDKFFEMEDNQTREPLFRALRGITLAKHETDPYYRDRINVHAELLVEAILDGKWKPRPLNSPPSCWKNDYRGKGYEFIKKCYEVKHGKSSND